MLLNPSALIVKLQNILLKGIWETGIHYNGHHYRSTNSRKGKPKPRFVQPSYWHRAISMVLCLMIVGGMILNPNSTYAYTDTGYSNASSVGYTNVNWMSQISDDMLLSYISIPGTHDTGTFEFDPATKDPELWGVILATVAGFNIIPFLGPILFAAQVAALETVVKDKTKTQSMNFDAQLASGIRAWDIRLGARDKVIFVQQDEDCTCDKLKVFHGVFPQGPSFWNVLNSASNFLLAHPSETIVMRIKRENGCSNNFAQSVKDAFDRYPNLLYQYSGNSHLRLGQVRGRVLLVQDFPGLSLGIKWDSVSKQDNFAVTNLSNKWNDVKNYFTDVDGSHSYLHFNYLSGTSPDTDRPYPNDIAGGYQGQEGINIRATRLLQSDVLYAGIIHADFPGAALIDAIIHLNFLPLYSSPDRVPSLKASSIKASVNDKFVCAENVGSSSLIANRTTVGLWERFQVMDEGVAGDRYIALRAEVNTLYVCAENGGQSPLVANRNTVGEWEQFKLQYLGNGKYALRAKANGKYVTAESAGDAPLIANRTDVGPWETFYIEMQ